MIGQEQPSPADGGPFSRASVPGRLATFAIFLFCLLTGLRLIVQESGLLFAYDDATQYGDSSVMYGVQRLQRTGSLYYDTAQQPYTPVLYSPAVYLIYALPGRLGAGSNPFLWPRLLALAAFLLCLGVLISLVRTLVPVPFAWIWTLLLVGSLSCLREWVVLLRGDFWAILCSLLAVRLLWMRPRWALVLAGLSAGLATQFKITYLAALAAGTFWLLLERRWKDAMRFLAAGAVTSAGIYLLFWIWQPRMISHITALRGGIKDIPGWLGLIHEVVNEPLFLLAPLGLSALLSRRWRLLLIYASFSFAIATLAESQSGAAKNYFFEGLFALTPAAVLGVLRLSKWSRSNTGAGVCLLVLVSSQYLIPAAQALYATPRSAMSPSSQRERNGNFLLGQQTLGRWHSFSTVPRIALFDSAPALTDPYLFSTLVQLGKIDAQPLVQRIRALEFDLTITAQSKQSWRGIPHISPPLRSAITEAYRPSCVWSGYLIHVPRNRPEDDRLEVDLQHIGCVRAVPGMEW